MAGCVSYLTQKPKDYTIGYYEIEQEFPLLSQTVHIPPKKIIPPPPTPLISSAYISDSVSDFLDLAFYQDSIFAVFSDAKQNYRAVVKSFNGMEWFTVGKAPITEDQAYWSQIAIVNDKLIVFYVDKKNNYSIAGKIFDGAWKDVSVSDLPQTKVGILKTKNHKNGLLLAFSDIVSGETTSAFWKNDQWTLLPKLNNYIHKTIDLDIISYKDNVYIALIDASVAYSILVYKLQNNEWKEIGNFSVIDYLAGDLSLACNNDSIYVSYVTYKTPESSCKVNLKKFSSGAWSTIGKPFSTPGKARFSELQIYNNNIFLAYANLVNKKPVILQLIKNEWVPISNEENIVGKTSYLSHMIYNNFSYVGYIDEANNYKAFAMPLPSKKLF